MMAWAYLNKKGKKNKKKIWDGFSKLIKFKQ